MHKARRFSGTHSWLVTWFSLRYPPAAAHAHGLLALVACLLIGKYHYPAGLPAQLVAGSRAGLAAPTCLLCIFMHKTGWLASLPHPLKTLLRYGRLLHLAYPILYIPV